MVGLTKEGLRAKIKNFRFELTEDEAVDMFFMYPALVELSWKNGNVTNAKVNGLNLVFSIKA